MSGSGDSRQGIAARHVSRGGAFYPAHPSPLDQVRELLPYLETKPRIVTMRGLLRVRLIKFDETAEIFAIRRRAWRKPSSLAPNCLKTFRFANQQNERIA
jgi:hypothetical protein